MTKESDAGSMTSIQKDDPATHPKRSRAKDFLLIGTVTLAMILNVSSSFSFTRIVQACIYKWHLQTSNMTAVSISLPTIGRDLDIPESKLQWLISAYSLSSVSTLLPSFHPFISPHFLITSRALQGCLLLFLGRIADLYGRKITFMLGCACMGIFGLGCGFAKGESSSNSRHVRVQHSRQMKSRWMFFVPSKASAPPPPFQQQ